MLDILLNALPKQEGICVAYGIPTVLHARSGNDKKHRGIQGA